MINESSVASVRHISRAALATVIAFILIVFIFTANAFAGVAREYNVVVNDNGYEYTITTDETEPFEILNKANITLGSNDRLVITDFIAGEGGTIVIDRLNTINVKLNDLIKSFDVYGDTVSQALAEAGINTENCIVDYDGTAAVENGMVITVVSPKIVTISADGESVKISAIGGTVKNMLELAGISLGENDYTEPSADASVTDGMEIEVYRVETKTVNESEKIPYDTVKNNDPKIERGITETLTKGENGEKSITYSVKYVNGQEVERKEISSTVTKKPVTEVLKVGTKPTEFAPNGVESYNGFYVGQVINGRYSHYCACAACNGNSRGVTTSGKRISNGMENPYYVACNWLPLGSVIDVNGTEYTVVDRGGSGLSKTGRIDIFTPEGHSACYKKGVGSCSITIKRLGW